MTAQTKGLVVVDSTLRDGAHAVGHSFTPTQVADIARALDQAGVPVIEVSHGDGIGGSSFNYGFAKHPDQDLLAAAVDAVERAKIALLLLPGIGLRAHLREAAARGVSIARIATHCTEADIGQQHIEQAKELGMGAVGFLMMAHMITPAAMVEQARLMEEAGADVVYVVDSAGAMTSDETAEKVRALRDELDCGVGVHAHNNLQLAVANAVAAYRNGADHVDLCLRGLGAGAGNTPTEVFVAVADKLGLRTGVDMHGVASASEYLVKPLMHREQIVDRTALLVGVAGVYSSFLLHAERAAERFSVDVGDIILELGRRRVVGGQEDMIVDVAAALAESHG